MKHVGYIVAVMVLAFAVAKFVLWMRPRPTIFPAPAPHPPAQGQPGVPVAPGGPVTPPARVMPVGVRGVLGPHRDDAEYPTRVIHSRGELDEVIANRGGNMPFANAVTAAKVDFNKEAIVLIAHVEGSGSVGVAYQTPWVVDGTMTVPIVTKTPGVGTADMAYYFAVYAVEYQEVDKVDVMINGTVRISLEVENENE